jgi:hypothetical protein
MPHVPNTGAPAYPLPADIPDTTEFPPDYWTTELTDSGLIYGHGEEGVAIGIARSGRIPAEHATPTAEVPAAVWAPVSRTMTVAVDTMSVALLSSDPKRRSAVIRCAGAVGDAVWISPLAMSTQPSLASPFPVAFRLPTGESLPMPYNGGVNVIPDSANAGAVVVSANVFSD